MAINKNALIRYQVLDRCFRNPGRMYFWQDLLEECNQALADINPESEGIQRRQLFDDIRFMKSEQGWAAPIESYRYGKRVYYRYDDLSFSINNQPLNDTEAEQIRSALAVLSRFSGAPQFEWVNEMIPFLEDKFGLSGSHQPFIAYESNIDLEGLKFITPLFNAIINERVLKVIYQGFKNPEPYEITFHPHYLKQYNTRWFAFGWNEDKDHPAWNLALDRIENLQETDLPYSQSNIDWEEYFYDIVGVTRPQEAEPEEVVLQFSQNVAPYVITKPLHPTQRHQYTESGLNIRIKVIPNFELEKLILSFGEDVKVVNPAALKVKISKRLKDASNQY
ncbi:MAG: WYL domain-containing protein [Bacteroidetes bacterium SW_10_40_5]|nr:MAG: WYL domain-containing protein [Bacteroidetes bacterium SW_10_40_5]